VVTAEIPSVVQLVRAEDGSVDLVPNEARADPLRLASDRGLTPWLFGTEAIIRLAVRARRSGWRVVGLSLRGEGWRALSPDEGRVQEELLEAVQRGDLGGALRVWASEGEHLFATRLELVDRQTNWRVWLGRFGSAELDARAGMGATALTSRLLQIIEAA
jgi:hypothetical protein